MGHRALIGIYDEDERKYGLYYDQWLALDCGSLELDFFTGKAPEWDFEKVPLARPEKHEHVHYDEIFERGNTLSHEALFVVTAEGTLEQYVPIQWNGPGSGEFSEYGAWVEVADGDEASEYRWLTLFDGGGGNNEMSAEKFVERVGDKFDADARKVHFTLPEGG